MENLKKIIHKECGKIAYYCTDREYHSGDSILSRDFYHIDKTPCEHNEEIRCGSCNKQVYFILTKNNIEATSE